MCICALEDCAATLDNTNSVLLCHKTKTGLWQARKGELKLLRRQQPEEETRLLHHHNGRRSFRIALAHFAPGDIVWRKKKPWRQLGAQASLMRAPEGARRATPEEQREKGKGRQHLSPPSPTTN